MDIAKIALGYEKVNKYKTTSTYIARLDDN